MFRYAKILALFLISAPALAQSPFIFGPSDTAKNLQSNAIMKRLKLLETGGGTDDITLQPPAALATPYTLTLPADDGTANQFLQSNGLGVLTWADAGASIGSTLTGGTTGSVLFVGAGPVLAQDNANFFWDDTNNWLGLGTTPSYPLHVLKAGGTGVTAWFLGSGTYSSLRMGNTSNGPTTKYLEITGGDEATTSNDRAVLRSVGYSQDFVIASSTSLVRIDPIFSGGSPGASSKIQTLRVGQGSNTFGDPTLLGSGGLGVFANDTNSSVIVVDTANDPHTRPLFDVKSAGNQKFLISGSGSTSARDFSIFGTAGAGYIDLREQSPEPAAGATGHLRVFAYGGFALGVTDEAGNRYLFDSVNLTADRAYAMPDGSGTLALEATIRTSTSNTSATCSVTCAAGEILSGGGGCSNTLALSLQNNYPSSTTTWSCSYALSTGNCTAHAFCHVP